MTKADLIASVGPTRYAAECALARTDAGRPDYGRDLGHGGPELELPHELQEHIWWEGRAGWDDRIALMFAVYDDMPAYGHLMYAKHHHAAFDPSARRVWWDGVRQRLRDSDPALRQPIQYALWCDYFEDMATVEEAWSALTGPTAASEILQAVLAASGPVPWRLKASLYARLIPDPAWHRAIYESLLWSATDVYGQLDREGALRVLDRLELSGDAAAIEPLRATISARGSDATE